MLKKAYLVESNSINPYHNLALEEYLFNELPTDSIIFYLWQNHHTVVIGKNQNAHKECDLKQMELDHCYLARRSTGGGAVYHDLGNLNFTFITSSDDHDIAFQSNIIINALSSFNIQAVLSGRNDIEVDHKKISGNAFMVKDQKKLQHGTILLNVDKNTLSKYLTVSKTKIAAKGVNSIKSRIENLTYFNPDINLDNLKTALKRSFSTVYGLQLEPMIPHYQWQELIEKYHSYNYIYNRIPDYDLVLNARLSFGEIEVYVRIINNYIMDIKIFTDSLELDFIKRLQENLKLTFIDDIAFKAIIKRFLPEDKIYLDDTMKLLNMIKEENDGL